MTMMIVLKGVPNIMKLFSFLAKDDIVQVCISDQDFRKGNVDDGGNEVGYFLHSIGIRYQQNFTAAQTKKVEFKFSHTVRARVYGYDLVLTIF